MKFADAVKQVMREKNLTVRQVIEAADLPSHMVLYRLESTGTISLNDALKMARALEIDLSMCEPMSRAETADRIKSSSLRKIDKLKAKIAALEADNEQRRRGVAK